jgi:hypothetical protein
MLNGLSKTVRSGRGGLQSTDPTYINFIDAGEDRSGDGEVALAHDVPTLDAFVVAGR